MDKIKGTMDTQNLPTTGDPVVVAIAASMFHHRYSDTYSIWIPGEGWRKNKRGSRQAYSTKKSAIKGLCNVEK